MAEFESKSVSMWREILSPSGVDDRRGPSSGLDGALLLLVLLSE